MINQSLSIRELTTADLHLFAAYWLNADAAYLASMGVDINKLPTKEDFYNYWTSQFKLPVEQRASYCVVWERNNIPVGHSSTRPVHYGKDAYMHIHLWKSEERQKGMGSEFINLTVPHYFDVLKLQDLYCEPYALNPAPNRLLEKAGFDCIKEYNTTPGPSNFPQTVKLWHLGRQQFLQLYKHGL
ncbi:MAG: GNAT family protein [Bacteroidota bacterium]